MNRRSYCLLAIVVLVTLGACGESLENDEPPKPPTKDQLSRIVATTRQPSYWLGPTFRGTKISAAYVRKGSTRFSYGPYTCDSGCIDSGGVGTIGRRRIEGLDGSNEGPIDPRGCWTRAGRAVAVLQGCDPDGYPHELTIYSGTREVYLTSLYTDDGEGEVPARTVVRGLRPLNANAPWPLPAPARFTCKEFLRLGRPYRRHAPDVIRPRADCAPPGR